MSCTKSKEVHPEIGDGNDEIVTVGTTGVHVEYTRTDHAELNRVVFHYCPADANGNAQQFAAAEMTKKETSFELTLNNLLSDTLYWYYYEMFPNDGSATNTTQKTFHTQAYETPDPPTPPTPPSGIPEGAINGLFTINENGDQVYFSQGNLQYQASTNIWRFAENQWDYVGGTENGIESGNVYEQGVKCDNTLISPTYNGWIDLFGWGTSGYNHGAVCYQPWDISMMGWDYYAYGSDNYNLNDQGGKADWGYNAISNGGNAENLWRTLTIDEWGYVLNARSTTSEIRYAKAQVNGVNGMILLPNDWSSNIYSLSSTNSSGADYSSNTISQSDWNTKFEVNGAVFLPAAFHRDGTYYTCTNYYGDYWSASYSPSNSAYSWDFDHTGIGFSNWTCRGRGDSVRLVQDAN